MTLRSVLLASLAALANTADVSPAEVAFAKFVQRFGRSYDSEVEQSKRFDIFAANFAKIEAENAKNNSFALAVNDFADLAPEEMHSQRLGLNNPMLLGSSLGLPHLGTHRYSGAELPDAVDWVEQGAVNVPSNQGQCGSCWTFSTMGALEGAWQIATGNLLDLSEQQLVDCARNGGNNGCNGGSMDLAFQFLENKAVCTAASYSYQGKAGTCAEDSCDAGIPSGGVVGYKDVESEDTDALMEAVSQQPVSVAIEADQTAFQFYSGGVLQKGCGTKLDHGVLLVGYGTDDGLDYWKIKNSWGSSWGEQGFIRIERGFSGEGLCGIKAQPVYPKVQAEESNIFV